MPTNVDRFDQLASLERDPLLSRWAEAYGAPPPVSFSRPRLIRGIAYQEQINTDPALMRVALALKKRILRTKSNKRSGHTRLHPGARLLREWRGRTHEVTVTDTGYVYRGQTYKSLSAIARQITGTRWSGPAFFGLTS